jgi:AP-1 complex subunit mu
MSGLGCSAIFFLD